MSLKVSIVGEPLKTQDQNLSDSLLIQVLGLAAEAHVELVSIREADLVLVHPYRSPFNSTATGALFESVTNRLSGVRKRGPEALLRRMYRIPARTRILAVSHENLDRRPWQVFGNLLAKTEIPRLTFWPQDLDPDGFRFPYWWNYVDWPEIPQLRTGKNTRFGALYDLDVLCESQDLTQDLNQRSNKAVWLTNHLEFPRGEILEMIRKDVEVDVIQGIPWGQKLNFLRSYKYCVTSENSPGFGYETEKNLEARMAGCIPIGYIQNPFSDFNENAFFFKPPTESVLSIPPLLKMRPKLGGLLEYISGSVL